MRRRHAFAVVATLVLALGVSEVSSSDPALGCQADQLTLAAKYLACRLRVEAKSVRSATTRDFSRCDAAFTTKFAEYEARAGSGVCPSTGDQARINTQIVSDAADLAVLLSGDSLPACDPNAAPLQLPVSGQTVSYHAGDDGAIGAGANLQYVDNGDGTITDLNTGLMWEKLSDDGTIHDRDVSYTWDQAFDVKIAALNAASFAGYGDWRLPNVKELHSIIAFSEAALSGPSVDPIFDTLCVPGCTILTCSCTRWELPGRYWSSTSVAADAHRHLAWFVNFRDGEVYDYSKDQLLYVRAVRSAS